MGKTANIGKVLGAALAVMGLIMLGLFVSDTVRGYNPSIVNLLSSVLFLIAGYVNWRGEKSPVIVRAIGIAIAVIGLVLSATRYI